jgi:hypothetical protein
VADQPLTRERANTVAYAIHNSQPYDAAEVALLLDFLSAELVAREGTVRNAMVLITHGKYRAARAFLAKISGEDL